MHKLLCLGVIVLAGCAGRSDGYVENEMDMDVHDGMKNWSATLEARANSGVLGSAAAQSSAAPGYDGNTAVAVTIGRAMSGGQHPWHVHTGTCATGGPIFGPASAYPVLRVGTDSNASATANVSMALDPNGSYHVNIHRSPSDLGTIVACGDLR